MCNGTTHSPVHDKLVNSGMNRVNFSKIAARYEEHSLVQRSAADMLLKILDIKKRDCVLDLGCGVGNMAREIRKMTEGRVVGIDCSEGMIKEAVEKSMGLDITFETKGVEELEDLEYAGCFDAIFCNSTFQWFRDPEKAVENCYALLRDGGRIGVQAPARRVYSPNFIEAIEKVKHDPEVGAIFAHFKEPWFFLETADEYRDLFEKCEFDVVLSEIECVGTEHTPEEVFNIFASGAAAGYLNQDFYDVGFGADYVSSFEKIVNDSFVGQADDRGRVLLRFNRIFLVALKSAKKIYHSGVNDHSEEQR